MVAYIILAVLALVVFLILRNESKAKAVERETASRKIAETILKNVKAASEAAVESAKLSNDEKRNRLINRTDTD